MQPDRENNKLRSAMEATFNRNKIIFSVFVSRSK